MTRFEMSDGGDEGAPYCEQCTVKILWGSCLVDEDDVPITRAKGRGGQTILLLTYHRVMAPFAIKRRNFEPSGL